MQAGEKETAILLLWHDYSTLSSTTQYGDAVCACTSGCGWQMLGLVQVTEQLATRAMATHLVATNLRIHYKA